MRVILKKLISDFRFSKSKLALLIIATALSAWGISGVVYSYYLTERDFEENFEKTFPADMALVIQGYDQVLAEKLLNLPEVLDIERREMVYARVKNARGNFIPILIYGIENPDRMRYDLIKFNEERNRVADQFLIERNAFFFFADGQEAVELIFKDQKEPVTWKVDGQVHDARQAPARMERMVYAYNTSLAPLLAHLPEGRQRLLIKTNLGTDKAALVALSEKIGETVEAHGAKVVGVSIPEPGEHIHQGIVDGIAFLQQASGLILAVMGIVLLTLILLTWVYPQLAEIGVMKAIGASRPQIFSGFVLVLLIIIGLGVLIGLPLGYVTASLYSGAVAFFQNFEPVRGLLPVPVHLLVTLVCLLIPLLFGVVPLLKSSRVTVNEALNKVFYVPNQGVFKWSQRLATGPQFRYSLNNLFRQSQRSLLLLLLMAVGLTLYFTATNVDHSIRADLKVYAEAAPYQVVVFLPEGSSQKQDFQTKLPFVESSIPLGSERVSYLPPDHRKPELTRLRILHPDFEMPHQLVQRGELDKSCSDCLYVSGDGMAAQFAAVPLGEIVALTGMNGETEFLRFAGVLKDLVVVGAPLIRFQDNFENGADAYAFKIKPHTSLSELEAEKVIDQAFRAEGINAESMSSVKRKVDGIIGHLEPSFLIIKITGIFTIILGLFGLLIVLNLTLKERTREIGVMKSLGSSFRKISNLYNREFSLVSGLALVLGALLSIPVATALNGVIAETIVGHPIAFQNDYWSLMIASVVVLLVQFGLVTVNNRLKISKNARELLDHHF